MADSQAYIYVPRDTYVIKAILTKSARTDRDRPGIYSPIHATYHTTEYKIVNYIPKFKRHHETKYYMVPGFVVKDKNMTLEYYETFEQARWIDCVDYTDFTDYDNIPRIVDHPDIAKSNYTGGSVAWWPDGQFKHNGQYKNGLRDNDWLWFDTDGNFCRKESYQNGLRHGVYRIWWPGPNGEVKRLGIFEKGLLDDEWNDFREDGTLESQRTYHNGRFVKE